MCLHDMVPREGYGIQAKMEVKVALVSVSWYGMACDRANGTSYGTCV